MSTRNINSQFTFAINSCFSEGADKHSYKAENGTAMGDKIFSHSERFRLKEVAADISGFLKTAHPDVRQVSQIQPAHIQEFLNSKTDHCTQNTINSYAASLYKLENVSNKTFSSCSVNWRENIAVPTAIRASAPDRGVDSVISRADYNKLLDYCKDSTAQSSYAIRLQDTLGIRVEELSRIKLTNVDMESGTVKIYGKGGKELTRQLTPQQLELVKEIKDQHFSKDKLFSISGASINQQLKRLEDKLGLERHSNHDIRRCLAQEKYDSYREQGYNQKQAMDKTSEWLAHGKDRDSMLERSYIHIH